MSWGGKCGYRGRLSTAESETVSSRNARSWCYHCPEAGHRPHEWLRGLAMADSEGNPVTVDGHLVTATVGHPVLSRKGVIPV